MDMGRILDGLAHQAQTELDDAMLEPAESAADLKLVGELRTHCVVAYWARMTRRQLDFDLASAALKSIK
jgi:hypothetical protein